MIKLSGVIITFNEERNIEKCLQSLTPVVDEIVVVDSFSTDNTKAICKKYSVKFLEQEFLGYVEQKNFALKEASYDYIVSLDGDEALSQELQKSIVKLKNNWAVDGYYCNRFNNFCGQWIKHSHWYPDKKLRVFDRRKAEWKGKKVHETVKTLQGNRVGFLKGDILHYSYRTYSEFNKQNEIYSTLSAEAYYEMGRKAPIWRILLNPTWAFFRSYFLKLGFLDGLNGLIICVQTANITFLKYTKLREIYRNKT